MSGDLCCVRPRTVAVRRTTSFARSTVRRAESTAEYEARQMLRLFCTVCRHKAMRVADSIGFLGRCALVRNPRDCGRLRKGCRDHTSLGNWNGLSIATFFLTASQEPLHRIAHPERERQQARSEVTRLRATLASTTNDARLHHSLCMSIRLRSGCTGSGFRFPLPSKVLRNDFRSAVA